MATRPSSSPSKAATFLVHRTWMSINQFFRSQFSSEDKDELAAPIFSQDIHVSSMQPVLVNPSKQGASTVESFAPGQLPKNFHLHRFLGIPHFPETPEDALDLLHFVHSCREERNLQMLATEHVIFQTIIHLKVLKRRTSHSVSVSAGLSELHVLRKELSELDAKLSEADQDVNTVHHLLERMGLPVVMHPAAFNCDDRDDMDAYATSDSSTRTTSEEESSVDWSRNGDEDR